jgi:U3 small nucleolar RNA-associated protein 7
MRSIQPMTDAGCYVLSVVPWCKLWLIAKSRLAAFGSRTRRTADIQPKVPRTKMIARKPRRKDTTGTEKGSKAIQLESAASLRNDDEDENRMNPKASQLPIDPDGSLHVARGGTSLDELKSQHAMLLKKAKSVQKIHRRSFSGSEKSIDSGKRRAGTPEVFSSDEEEDNNDERRLKSLHQDDAAPDWSKLSDRQKHALRKRGLMEVDIGLLPTTVANRLDMEQSATAAIMPSSTVALIDSAATTDAANQVKTPSRPSNFVHRFKMLRHETKRYQAIVDNTSAINILQSSNQGLLEAETDMERTTAVSQAQLLRTLPSNDPNRFNIFELNLPDAAPYGISYDRSGRFALFTGQSTQHGHIAVMDCMTRAMQSEIYVREAIRDATFLHNSTLYAVAQKNCVYIYDSVDGTEIHCLNDHIDPISMTFLPYHFLLSSVGRAGYLKYTDTSTGKLVSQHRTAHSGPPSKLIQNPSSGILHLGHTTTGYVTLWTPASSTYVAKMLCHKGTGVGSLCVDRSGRYMVTGGVADRTIKVWDLRMFQSTHQYYTIAASATAMDLSQTDMLAVGHGGHVTIWNAEAIKYKATSPYMHHALPPQSSPVNTIKFRPFEDVMGVGHGTGISSCVIPGSGDPHYDTMEYNLNPVADRNQRREDEVRALLEKLPPDTITLQVHGSSVQVGSIEPSNQHYNRKKLHDIAELANSDPKTKHEKVKVKKKNRGRSKIRNALRRKQRTIIDRQTQQLRQAREEASNNAANVANVQRTKSQKVKITDESNSVALTPAQSIPSALKRFL